MTAGLRGSRPLRSAKVGAVIVNYQSDDDTVEAIDALLRSDMLDLEIVVADNGPTSPGLQGKLPANVTYLATGENLGYAGGNNRGIGVLLERDVEYVLILNPDARVEPTTLSGLLAAATDVPDAGFIGPRLLHGSTEAAVVQSDGGRIDWSRAGAPVHLNVDIPAIDLPTGRVEVDYVTGACVLVSRRVLEDVGLFPEEYFLYFEETDLAVRAARRGWASLVDRAVTVRHHRRSTGVVPSRSFLYYLTRNRGIFASRFVNSPKAVEDAYVDYERHSLRYWRAAAARLSPDFGALFNEVAELAREHGSSGVVGRWDELARFRAEGLPGWE